MRFLRMVLAPCLGLQALGACDSVDDAAEYTYLEATWCAAYANLMGERETANALLRIASDLAISQIAQAHRQGGREQPGPEDEFGSDFHAGYLVGGAFVSEQYRARDAAYLGRSFDGPEDREVARVTKAREAFQERDCQSLLD